MTSNINLQELIRELKTQSIKNNQPIWKRVASDLEKPNRQRRIVNLSKISRYTKEGEIIVIPGKVLGAGDLNHKLTVAAWRFSKEAKSKILSNKSKAISINELMKSNIKGKKVRIIG